MSLSFYLDKPSRHRRLGTPEWSDNQIRTFFYEMFPRTRKVVLEQNRRLAKVETISPVTEDGQYPYGEVGMALDYRLRYYFSITPYQELVAWQGAQRHQKVLEDKYHFPANLFAAFFIELQKNLNQTTPVSNKLEHAQELQLNRYCFVLALLEQLFRINPHPKNPLFAASPVASSISSLLSIPDNNWLEDLCLLSWRFYETQNQVMDNPCILNPTFTGSLAIGGADADLVLNHCLIDIKTTITATISNTMLYQLIGYALLDYEDKYALEKVGLYLSRQGMMVSWDLADLMNRLFVGDKAPPLEDLRQQFKEVVESQRAHERKVLREQILRRRLEAPPQ